MDHRLKKNSQFSYIYKKGERISTEHFTLFVVKSRFECYKIGLSINKKIGKAHTRNKLKRRVREIVRKTNVLAYRNYVLMARNGAEELEFKDLEKEIKRLFEKYEKRA